MTGSPGQTRPLALMCIHMTLLKLMAKYLPVDIFQILVALGGTGTVEGSSFWYVAVQDQYEMVLVDIWW